MILLSTSKRLNYRLIFSWKTPYVRFIIFHYEFIYQFNLLTLNMKLKYIIIRTKRAVQWNDAPQTYFSGREVNTCLQKWRRIDGLSRIVNF